MFYEIDAHDFCAVNVLPMHFLAGKQGLCSPQEFSETAVLGFYLSASLLHSAGLGKPATGSTTATKL